MKYIMASAFKFEIIICMLVLCQMSLFNCKQIFDDVSYKNCDNYEKSALRNYTPKSKSWRIKSKRGTLLLSPCGNSYPCDKSTVICLIKSNNNVETILGSNYDFKIISDNTLFAFGLYCRSSANYSITITFSCNYITPEEYWLNNEDECDINIRLPKLVFCKSPMKGTHTIDGNVIDLTPLQDIAGINVSHKFAIGFWKSPPECNNKNAAVCKLTTEIQNLADIDSQDVTFDKITNKLIVTGRHHVPKKKGTSVEILLKCNWDTEYISNATYLEDNPGSKKFKFKMESSLACIKFPMNCLIRNTFDSLMYNLTSLYRSNGWIVENFMNGTIHLNLCGPLNLNNLNNECAEQNSQVCLIDKNKNYVNLGSIANFEEKDELQINFEFGSICEIDRLRRYKTTIEFICAPEKQPTFIRNDDCVYILRWETPTACEKQYIVGDNTTCKIEGFPNNHYDLSSISMDRRLDLNDSFIKYNLCGILETPCSNFINASVCLTENGKEYAIGFVNKSLKLVDYSLMLELSGSYCKSNVKSQITVNFYCGDESNIKFLKKDNCVFEMQFYTKVVCKPVITNSCFINSRFGMYNLSSLSNPSDNYIVRDDSSKTEYILNICRSLVNVDNLTCGESYAICLHNQTALGFKSRYKPIAQVNYSWSKNKDQSLTLLFSSSTYCETGQIHNATITFYCSEHEGHPKILKSERCFHSFVWETKYACLIKNDKKELVDNTIIPYLENKKNYENNIQDSSILSDGGHIKSAPFIENVPNTLKKEENLEKNDDKHSAILPFIENKIKANIPPPENKNILENNIQNSSILTSDGDKIKNIPFIENVPNKEHNLERKFIENTKVVRKEQHFSNSTKNISSYNDITMNTNGNIPNYSNKKSHANCTIKISKGQFNVMLNNIQNIMLQLSNDNYTVLFKNQTELCHGFICRNNQVIVPVVDVCPKYIFNKSSSFVRLTYNSIEKCSKTLLQRVNLDFKCNSTGNKPNIREDMDCTTVITYPLKEACDIFPNEKSVSYAGVFIGIPLAMFLLIVFLLIIWKTVKKYKHRREKQDSAECLMVMYKND